MMRTADLARLRRAGLPFPADHGEEPAPWGAEASCVEFGVLGEVMPGGLYLRFWCPVCQTDMFQANSSRGILHARKVARTHKPLCCAQRAAWGHPSVWPDEE
jgi:hypothetical protein